MSNTKISLVDVKKFGAVGDDATDDYAAFQAASDYVIANKIATLFIPAGKYFLSKGISFDKPNGGSTDYNFIMLTIQGDSNSYDPAIGGGTQIRTNNASDFIFGIQYGKGCTIKNINFVGMNSGLQNFHLYEIANPATNWTTNGTRDNIHSPHCAISFDPYGSAAIAGGDQYPTRGAKYFAVGGGNTDFKVENCVFNYFNCAIAVSTSGTTQSGEGMIVERCYFNCNTDCIGFGNSQTRNNIARDNFMWVNNRTFFSGQYGQGIVAPIEIDGLNIAGGAYEVYRINAWRQDIYAQRIYAELLYMIGGNYGAVNSNFFFTNCFLDFLNGIDNGVAIKKPLTMLNCSTAVFNGGRLGYYVAPHHSLRVQVQGGANGTPVLLNGTQLDQIAMQTATTYMCVNIPNQNNIVTDDYKTIKYLHADNNNGYVPIFSTNEDLNVQVSSAPILTRKLNSKQALPYGAIGTLLHIDLAANITYFDTNDAGYLAKIAVGDYVSVYDAALNDDFGNNGVGFGIGGISSIVNNAGLYRVTVDGIMNGIIDDGIKNYSVYNSSVRYLKASHYGVVALGSNIITGVVCEGGNAAIHQIGVNDFIFHPAFPNYTRITAIGAGTLTLSQAATAADANAIISTCDYTQTLRADIAAIPANYAFKKGDEVINNFSDAAHDTIEKWICTVSGLAGTAIPPVFTRVVLT